MANLPEYQTLEEKRLLFQESEYYQIDERRQLDDWYSYYTAQVKIEHPTDFIYRGVNEAKFKIYSSAQRLWIQENLSQWRDGMTFMDFVRHTVHTAKANRMIAEIFDLYGYSNGERDFPIISLLQHYGAPTPVVDWTYDLNRAIYFAIEGVRKSQARDPLNINHYMAIYLIDRKNFQNDELFSLLDIFQGDTYPSIDQFHSLAEEESPNANVIFTLSDFETTIDQKQPGPLRVVTTKPLTSVFNQNIIAQKGLLMFNPFQDRPIEALFNVNHFAEGSNLQLNKFHCFHIHKDLSEYLRRKIQEDFTVSKSTVYPNLYDDVKSIKEGVLNSIARS